MLRRYLEIVSGIFTGSDEDIGADAALQSLGLIGAETTSDSNLVWVTKTHYPVNHMHHGTFHGQKMIKIVRNPLDCLLSYAHMAATMTHSGTPVE